MNNLACWKTFFTYLSLVSKGNFSSYILLAQNIFYSFVLGCILHCNLFYYFKRCPTHIISTDLHGTMVHFLQSLLVSVLVSQGWILCKSFRFTLFQDHVKCQDNKEFFWGLHKCLYPEGSSLQTVIFCLFYSTITRKTRHN